MADEKTKRLRTHVVKELFETEKAYTDHLDFTVGVLLKQAREKGEHDNTFTDSVLEKLFCNIESILDLHRKLVEELNAALKGGVAYGSLIAGVYLKFEKDFLIYQDYGKGNEGAQKLLYELEDNDNFQAFFLACLLLGGRDDGTGISSYLFKPIQRITKYPLLFRELEKYTPRDHPDYEATHDMGLKMREICCVINEAKRAVEKLDAIADWQASVDGWEGSNVTDTCNEFIKEGSLIKISVGNTQERTFSLFDNLLVYCKKSLLSRSRPLLFRGRIPMENLDVEDIEDGTADFHTSGITVTNSWKVHNIAKNKWFVLIARSPEEKKEWMEAIRTEKEKKKRSQRNRGRAIYNLMVTKGEKLYLHAKHKAPLIRDHKVRLRTFTKCFTGTQFVSWLVEQKEVSKEDEAVILGQHLLENGIIHHVNDKHQFKKGDLLYRFRYDDGTYRTKYDSSELSARSVRMYCRLHGLFDPIIKDHKGSLIGGAVRNVLNAQILVDWLLEEHDIISREEGVALGREFLALGVLRHATDGQDFRDTNTLYLFTADEAVEPSRESRRGVPQQSKGDFLVKDSQSCLTLTVPYSEKEKGYGFTFKDDPSLPVSIKSSSPHAQLCGVIEGLTVVCVNGHSSFGHSHLLLSPSDHLAPPPLHLTVLCERSKCVKLRPLRTGLGFHIRGHSPVVIHGVDKESAAAQAGILSGSCILEVGQQNVMKASHESVVTAVKQSLKDTEQREDGPWVDLKISYSHMEQLVQYEYETSNHTHIQVYERILDSPYIFSIPGQLLKLLATEAVAMAASLEGCGVREGRVTTYIAALRSLGQKYDKAQRFLKAPRYPSYKPFCTTHASVLDPCPCNLHTSQMDVLSPSSAPPPPTSPSSSLKQQSSEDDMSSPVVSVDTTSYHISTMACPTPSHTFTKKDLETLDHSRTRRDLLQELQTHVMELVEVQKVLQKFLDELGAPCQQEGVDNHLTDSTGLLAVPTVTNNDLTPNSSPSSSPAIQRRARYASISDPLPAIKLEVEGLCRKVDEMVDLLQSKLLVSIVEEVAPALKKDTAATLKEFCVKLSAWKKQVLDASSTPGPQLTSAVQGLLDTANTYIQEVGLFVSLSLADCDNLVLLQIQDQLFSQCVVALATAFSHQLLAALRGHFNPEPEFGTSNEAVSNGWLQLVAGKGVLFHMETLMSVANDKELKHLEDLNFVAKQLGSVRLHVVAMESTLDVKSEFPVVTLSGNRSALHLTFALSPHLYASLPATLHSSRGLKVFPVLFNKGLFHVSEGTVAYQREKDINNESLNVVKDYYRQLRSFRLGHTLHRQTSEEKAVAIQEISQPLHALELLSHQLEVAVREPTRPGIGLLTVAAELTTRMGALRVCVCDSGVFRSGTACSLEQVTVLARSHQLPMKSFRLALNTMRKNGTLKHLLRENEADMHVSLPQRPPKLYQLPADM